MTTDTAAPLANVKAGDTLTALRFDNFSRDWVWSRWATVSRRTPKRIYFSNNDWIDLDGYSPTGRGYYRVPTADDHAAADKARLEAQTRKLIGERQAEILNTPTVATLRAICGIVENEIGGDYETLLRVADACGLERLMELERIIREHST